MSNAVKGDVRRLSPEAQAVLGAIVANNRDYIDHSSLREILSESIFSDVDDDKVDYGAVVEELRRAADGILTPRPDFPQGVRYEVDLKAAGRLYRGLIEVNSARHWARTDQLLTPEGLTPDQSFELRHLIAPHRGLDGTIMAYESGSPDGRRVPAISRMSGD